MKVTVTKLRDILTPDLRSRARRAKFPRKALEAMGLAITSLAQRAFTQSSLRPAVWPPLKAATIKAKKRKGYGSKPLIASASLAHSPRIVSVDNRKVVVGSDRRAGRHSLASIHQFGSKDGRVPARPFFPFTKSGQPTERARRNVQSAARRALDLERP
jgi:phage gpG-like protein